MQMAPGGQHNPYPVVLPANVQIHYVPPIPAPTNDPMDPNFMRAKLPTLADTAIKNLLLQGSELPAQPQQQGGGAGAKAGVAAAGAFGAGQGVAPRPRAEPERLSDVLVAKVRYGEARVQYALETSRQQQFPMLSAQRKVGQGRAW
jgi:hypothetical protein